MSPDFDVIEEEWNTYDAKGQAEKPLDQLSPECWEPDRRHLLRETVSSTVLYVSKHCVADVG
jgi:hypothetical protein